MNTTTETTTTNDIAEVITSTKKARKETVKVDDMTFIGFVAECKKNGLSQTKMSREYATKFGGAEGSAIQKYTTMKKRLEAKLEKDSKAEQTEENKALVAKTKRVLDAFTLKLQQGEGSRPRTDVTSEKTLDDILNLFGEGDKTEEKKEEAGIPPETPTNAPESSQTTSTESETENTRSNSEAPKTQTVVSNDQIPAGISQMPRRQIPILVEEQGDVHINTDDVTISIHHKQKPVKELQAV